MKQLPVLFNTEMVQAILDGRKTQTRRIIKPQPSFVDQHGRWYKMPSGGHSLNCFKMPYNPGDLLYVREKWMIEAWIDSELYIRFAATPDDLHVIPARYDMEIREFFQRYANKLSYSPTIHMPKAFARTWLKITNVKAERLQDISEQDAIAEGIELLKGKKPPTGFQGLTSSPEIEGYRAYGKENIWTEGKKNIKCRYAHNGTCISSIASFKSLWDTVHGPGAWVLNPWVWVITFEKTQPPETT